MASDGFDGDASNEGVVSFDVFEGYLYAGTYNVTTGCEVWRCQECDGSDWDQVNNGGFSDWNGSVSALAAFEGYLYASTTHAFEGAQVWRCQSCGSGTDWAQVVDNGFGNTDTLGGSALEVFKDRLYLILGTVTTGMEVWRTEDGIHWEQIGYEGFGDSNNHGPYWDNSVAVANGQLYVGSWNYANGGEIWTEQLMVYVPLVMKNF